MSSSLITVNWNDQSATTNNVVGSTGATVIDSPRGGDEPVYFYTSQTSRILDYFGIPDTDNVGVAEILKFNASYPLWISAPSTGGSYAGVLVTKTGTQAFYSGASTTDSDTFSFSAVENSETLGTGDGTTTEFSVTVSDYSHYNAESIDITVDGTSESLTVTSSDGTETLTGTNGSGTFIIATGVLTYTFTTAPTASQAILATYTTDYSSDAYFVLFDKNPQVSDLEVKCTLADATTGEFKIYLYKESRTTSGTYKVLTNWPKTLSTVSGTENGYSENIFIDDYLEDNDYVVGIANTALTVSTFTDDTSAVLMKGGVRGTTSATQLATGWSYFESKNNYQADIFFDTTADSSISTIFETISDSYQMYSSFIVPMANTSAATAITNISDIMTDDKNIAFYWGWGKIYNSYTDSYLASPLTGRVALRYADMNDVYNGLEPAWYNENGTHGGQLGTGIKKMFYDADDDAQQDLEDVRINPIVKHPSFGYMISRARTSQSEETDYADIGHVRLANYIVSNALDVLPYQLYKLNDTTHRASVKSQIEAIISPTAVEPYNLLEAYTVKCDSENNDSTVLQANQFVVSVAIEFTPSAHQIVFNITNTPQGSDVEDYV